jgi:hypothetical protein
VLFPHTFDAVSLLMPDERARFAGASTDFGFGTSIAMQSGRSTCIGGSLERELPDAPLSGSATSLKGVLNHVSI